HRSTLSVPDAANQIRGSSPSFDEGTDRRPTMPRMLFGTGRMSRRALMGGVTLSTLGAIIAACQQAAPPATPSPVGTGAVKAGASPSGQKVKLTYLQLDDPVLKKIRNSITDDFQKETGNTVESIVASNDQLETKRNALFAAGTPPDVFVGQGGSQNIATLADILLDLEPYIQHDPKTAQVDKYYDRAIAPMKYQGKTLEWPAYAIVMVLAFNKDMFDAAGVKYPTNDWTYDDLINAGRKLTTQDSAGKPKTWGVTIDRRSYIEWMNGLWARGSDIFTEDLKKLHLGEQAGINTFQWLFDKVNKYNMSPGPGQDIQGGFAAGNYA